MIGSAEAELELFHVRSRELTTYLPEENHSGDPCELDLVQSQGGVLVYLRYLGIVQNTCSRYTIEHHGVGCGDLAFATLIDHPITTAPTSWRMPSIACYQQMYVSPTL